MAAKNPPMYYPLHHFVMLPLTLLILGYTIYHYTQVAGDNDQIARLWFSLAAVALTVLLTIVLMRQHYALKLQDRVIRLEVRQRYFELTGKRFAELERQLNLPQILNLRLAGDNELPALAEAAAREKLDGKAIQARINNFQPDTMRV